MKIYPVLNLLDGQFAISPCPHGHEHLEKEINYLKDQGYGAVISMLTTQEQTLHGLDKEATICQSKQILYVNYPIRDEVARSDQETIAFVKSIKPMLDLGYEGKTKVLFHCRGGVGRSSMMMALSMATYGLDVTDVFDKITQAQGEQTPESIVQLKWIEQLAEQFNN